MKTAPCAALLLLLPLPASAQVAFPDDELRALGQPPGDGLGGALAIDGDLLAVGARFDSTLANAAGSATVFERAPDGSWVELTTLTPPNPTPLAQFGRVLAVSGEQVIVGSPRDSSFGFQEGALYVYERQADGSWPLVQTLAPPVPAETLGYATAVDVEGDVLVVGALATGFDPEQVHVYERQLDGVWQLHSTVLLDLVSNPLLPVRLDGDLLVAGADILPDEFAGGSGRVFLWRRQADGSFLPLGALEPSVGVGTGEFGAAVDVDAIAGGHLVAVGAPGYAPPRVFVYEVSDAGATALVDVLFCVGGDCPNQDFGRSVAIAQGRIAAGSPDEAFMSVQSSRVVVADRLPNGGWLPVAVLGGDFSSAAQEAVFGEALLFDGTTLMVGNPGPGPAQAVEGGRVDLFIETSLFHGPTELSLAAGGQQALFVAGGPELAGAFYVVLGSASGTAPGLPLPGGLELPLVVDAYTLATLDGGAGVLTDSVGQLDAAGSGLARLQLQPGTAPALAGLTVHHAFVAGGPGGTFLGVGGPVPLHLLP